MTWKAIFNNPVDKHSAYRAAVAADAAWSRELQRVYGKRAGDARYDKRGVATPELRRLHDAWVAAERRRENPFPSTPKGFQYSQAFPGLPRIGKRVVVQAKKGSSPLDWPYIGRTGVVLGYSLPHGFAIVDSEGEELLIHPESLEEVR